MKQRQCNSRMPLSVVSFGWSSEFLAPKCKVYTPLFRIRTTFDILWLVTNSMKNGIIIKNLLKQTKVICIHTPEHCYFLSRYLGRTQEYNFVILARELERQVLMFNLLDPNLLIRGHPSRCLLQRKAYKEVPMYLCSIRWGGWPHCLAEGEWAQLMRMLCCALDTNSTRVVNYSFYLVAAVSVCC